MLGRTFRLLLALGTTILIAACGGPSDAPSTPQIAPGPIDLDHVNVLWIVLDACRADHLSAYGYHRPTSPNIDALAARGTVFERNFSQASATAPSVPIYMTGRTNAVAYQDPGGMGLWFFREPLEGEKPISTIFRENGYLTGMFSASAWYSERSRLGQSFDEFYWLYAGADPVGETYREQNPPIFQWLENRAQHPDQPFFMYLHTLDTHGPRYPRNTDTTWLDPDFPQDRDTTLRTWDVLSYHGRNETFDARDRAHLANLYDGGVKYTDRMMGEIFDHLVRLGLAESTIVIVTSDHGELIGEDGHTVSHPWNNSTDTLLHVPLIVAGPGIPSDHRVPVMTQSADIVPTLVDLLNLETDAMFHGKSLRPLLENPNPDPLHSYVYAESTTYTMLHEPVRVIIYEDYKFDLSPLPEDAPLLPGMERRPQEIVYAMPDQQAARRIVQPPQARLEEARRILAEELVPRWEQKDAMPTIIPPMFQLPLQPPYLHTNFTAPQNAPDDDRWTEIDTSRVALMKENVYVAYPFSETPKGLIFDFKNIPDGTYDISVYSQTLPTHPDRGVSFKFYVPDADESAQHYRLPPSESDSPTKVWHEVGRYDVTDEHFSFWIDVSNPEDVAVVGSLRFLHVDAAPEAESLETMEERLERLRSLGYVE